MSSDSEASSASTSRSTSPIPQPASPARIAAEALKNSNLPAQVSNFYGLPGCRLCSRPHARNSMLLYGLTGSWLAKIRATAHLPLYIVEDIKWPAHCYCTS